MFTQSDILKVIQENTDEIRTYGIKKIGIFGSFAKATQRDRSDIDVLIEFERGKKAFDNYMELKFLLEKIFHRRVDLVIKEALKPEIKRNILQEVRYARI